MFLIMKVQVLAYQNAVSHAENIGYMVFKCRELHGHHNRADFFDSTVPKKSSCQKLGRDLPNWFADIDKHFIMCRLGT